MVSFLGPCDAVAGNIASYLTTRPSLVAHQTNQNLNRQDCFLGTGSLASTDELQMISSFNRTAWLFAAIALLALVFPCIETAVGEDADSPEKVLTQEELVNKGKAIYEKSCAVCHGEKGEGVEEFYADPLVGDLSVNALAELITETMPEDDPESCVGEEAQAVSAFVHSTFYSQAAQTAIAPPRTRLARLTKRQIRQSLADLYGYTTGSAWSAQDHGLRGLYFDGSGRNDRNKIIERTDLTINFDFGDKGPGQGVNPESFFIDWRGALKVDSTGNYEIVVRSSCAFVCYFGAYDRKFIDNHVQSGDKSEFRRSIRLTAGRAYPIRIDFFQRKRKTEQPPAMISLSWVNSQGIEEIIPAENLIPGNFPAAFSLQGELPPDDRSYGYERGISVDRQWDDSTTEAALEFAAIAIEELWPQHKQRNKNNSDENRAHLRGFLSEIIESAFRGPLTEEDRQKYVNQPVDANEDDLEAIRHSLLMALKSPRFLYCELDHDRSKSQRAANRLALVLFDSLPTDKWFVQLARGNKLEGEEAIRAAARRMVYDRRTQSKTRQFLHEWLNIGEAKEVPKDSQMFAGFDPELVNDLRSSLDKFLDEIVWSEASDYRQLFLSDWTFTNKRLEQFYGESWRPAENGTGLRRSVSDAEHRFGVLTHPYLMSRLAYHNSTSPIHRGVFLIRHVLGRTIRPPQDAFKPLSPDLHPDLTTRQRVELQTGSEGCQVCHKKINGLGFTLENYDAVGRYRVTERDQSIDATGLYTTKDDQDLNFGGPKPLAEFLAGSSEAHQAFVNRAFQHFVKQPPAAFGPDTLDKLTSSFTENKFNIRQLILEIAVLTALDAQPTEEEANSDAKSDDKT